MVRETGGLVIADEVRAGFCGTGGWWGYQVTDFVPDIATMGKPGSLERALANVECPAMGGVRGCGLFHGVEWVSDRSEKTPDRDDAKCVVDRLKGKDFLIGSSGCHDATLKVRPPLVFGRERPDAFPAAVEETVGELS